MLIETRGLTKIYKAGTVVNNLNISIPEGSFTAFLGPNGAGKSTTIAMLINLLTPSSGHVIYDDQLLNEGQFSVVFQHSVLDPTLTVTENLALRARMRHGSRAEALADVQRAIDLTNLGDLTGQRYGRLSGGQRRRVDIARALLNRPRLLFLDEPTTGLDIQTRSAIWQLLNRINSDGTTIFLTTHYLEEADNASLVYIIDHGSIIAQGSATELKRRYAQVKLTIMASDLREVKALIGPRHPGHIVDDRLVIELPDSITALSILEPIKNRITGFECRSGSMDDVFLKLTGREMR
jgi:multidrug/hemolysin transport system ATP-binding protein